MIQSFILWLAGPMLGGFAAVIALTLVLMFFGMVVHVWEAWFG